MGALTITLAGALMCLCVISLGHRVRRAIAAELAVDANHRRAERGLLRQPSMNEWPFWTFHGDSRDG
jgi:hypothetical protein